MDKRNRILLFKIAPVAFILIVLLSFTSLSCGNNELTAEIVGRWEYSFPPGLDDVPNFEYEPECGLIDAYPITSAEIDGKGYLILGFPPRSSAYHSCLFIFDTENPLSPRLIATITPETPSRLQGMVNSFVVYGDIIYSCLFGDNGLWMVDISHPENPVDLGIAPIEVTSNIVVAGDYAYASGQMYDGVTIMDISDTQDVREINRIDLSTREHCLAVAGEHLYVGIKQTLTIFDISNPASPKNIGTCELVLTEGLVGELPFYTGEIHWANWASIINIEASGDYVYLTFGAGQVKIIDVSDPKSPREAADIDLGGFAINLTLKDNYLYVTKSDAETQLLQFCIVDVSEPEKPEIMYSVATESIFGFGGASLAYMWARPQVMGDYVYIAGINYMDIVEIK